MDNISSILASFNINQVTEQYCDDLRRQREGRLPRKERETLERTIREFRNEDQGTVLGAIVIYAVFCPDEAIQYARQKGVFYYGSAWPRTEYCLEHLNSLSELLHIPQHQQRFFQQKLSCRWLGRFYRETEEKLRRDIRRHYRERIKKNLHGVLFEGNLIIELLAYINVLFRYRGAFTAKASAIGSPDKNNKCVSDYSNEEISEAASYLIYLFTEEKGFQPKKEKWLDIDYILFGKIDKLVLLACHRNLILEWEFLVDCLGYELEADEKSIRIFDPSGQLDMSSEALQDETVQKTYFSQWGISPGSRTVHTCILLGNRLFAVPNGMRHPVRYAYELNMVLTSGTINSNLGHWSCWAGEQFADEDLVRYLSDADPLSKSFLESMKPYTETFCCQGKTMQLNSIHLQFSAASGKAGRAFKNA